MNIPIMSKTITVKNSLTSKAGYIFDRNDTNWQIDKNNKINVGAILILLNEENKNGFIDTLAFYASNYSGSYTNNISLKFLRFLRVTGSSVLTESVLINYRSTLTIKEEWHLGSIKAFLNKWYELGFTGVTSEFIELLNSWRLCGFEKGAVVKRLDPERGPLTTIERQAFNEGVVQAYEKNLISLSQLAMNLLMSNTGRRSIQITHLKIKDVLLGKNIKGEDCYFINIPRAKQRESNFRDHFKSFAITRELWVILNSQANLVKRQIKELLKIELAKELWLEIPLFPDLKAFENIEVSTDLNKLLQTDYLHIKSESVTKNIKRDMKHLNIKSERTGKLLSICAYRFRYTMGTCAAREGFGSMVIAELLDHSDIQNAGVYIENIPDHVAKLDEAIGHQLAPYAQAFAGVLVDAEKDAQRGGDLNSRIKTNGENIATCGSYGFCGANVPIPCYTCMHFQPWLDGPHQVVLDKLINERARLLEVTGDIQIAAINDRSILAVANVIQLCAKRREELKNGSNI